MKLAIIADIHGNIHALEAVLRDLSRVGVDRVIVNGDMVNRGPHSVEVMARLWKENFDFTLGNHDDLMRLWVTRDPKIPNDWFGDSFWRATEIAAEALDANGWLEKIRLLPMTQTVRIESAPTLLIAHGSPRHYREGFGAYTKEKVFSELTSVYDASIFIGSHTHRPWESTFNGQRFINTGAVGAPFNRDPRAQYLIMHLRQNEWRPEFRQVEYNRDAAICSFLSSGFLEQGLLSAHIFCEELRCARPLYDPFWRWADRHALPRIWEVWMRFRRDFAEYFLPLKPSPNAE